MQLDCRIRRQCVPPGALGEIVGWSGIVLSWLLAQVCFAGPARAEAAKPTTLTPTTDPRLDAIWQTWDARRTEIVTADIRLREVAGAVKNHAWTPDQVREILAGYDLVGDPNAFATLIRSIWNTDFVRQREPPWIASTLVMRGNCLSYRNDPFYSIRDENLEFHWDGDNRQVCVYPAGRSRRAILTLDRLRWIPAEGIDAANFRIASDAEGRLELASVGGGRMTVDAATGLVPFCESRMSNGELYSHRWEQGIVEFPGGIPFPTVRIEVDYRDGLVFWIAIRLIDEARFNVDVPETAFQMPGHVGDKLIDYRTDQGGGTTLTVDTADLRTILPPARQAPTPVAEPSEPESLNLRWVLLLNSVLLLGAAVYLWRRDRTPREFRLHVKPPNPPA